MLVLSEECVISSILSHHSKDLKQQTSVTAQLQLRTKDSSLWRYEGGRTAKERPQAILAPSFLRFCLPHIPNPTPQLPLCKLGLARKGACLFHLRFSLQSMDISFVPFLWASPILCLLALYPVLHPAQHVT